MRGDLLPIWTQLWCHVWRPLERRARELEHPDMFCELYREANQFLKTPKSIEDIADVTDNIAQARRAFRSLSSDDFATERKVVEFLEAAFKSMEELSGDALANSYFVLLDEFLVRFSVRYDLRRPCLLCPTLPGVFASLIGDLRTITSVDPHLNTLMKEFESAVRDLRNDSSDGRIKTCIQKQVNLIEAIGCTFPGVTQTTLGAICNQIGTWPHKGLKESLKNLYGFASDYPGIRHGGRASQAARPIEMRDMIAVSILLAGFTPYLSSQLNAEVIYRGS